jgi:hypothetical protein
MLDKSCEAAGRDDLGRDQIRTRGFIIDFQEQSVACEISSSAPDRLFSNSGRFSFDAQTAKVREESKRTGVDDGGSGAKTRPDAAGREARRPLLVPFPELVHFSHHFISRLSSQDGLGNVLRVVPASFWSPREMWHSYVGLDKSPRPG